MFMFAAPANTNIRGAAPRTPGGAAAGPDVGDTKGKEFQMITSVRLAVILFCLIAPSGGAKKVNEVTEAAKEWPTE